MKKPQARSTTAANLEAKFDRGEEVLDYFETGKAKCVAPRHRPPAQYIVELVDAETVVRESSGNYAGTGSKKGAVKSRTQAKNPNTGDYPKRNETPGSKMKGEFMDNKKGGESISRRPARNPTSSTPTMR